MLFPPVLFCSREWRDVRISKVAENTPELKEIAV